MAEQDPKPPAEAELVERQTAVALPVTPYSLQDLAASEEGEVVIQRTVDLVRALRAASIALTYPHDWVLFKADERITGFCQDAGCDRFRDFWGIEVFDLGPWERNEDNETKDFSWSITASGRSLRTGQVVHNITGVRYSYEDFITRRKLPRLQQEQEVKKAARANLEGTIIRELAGMKSVPIEELDLVWKTAGMTYKETRLCPRGRGFGSGDERAGGSSDKTGGLDQADIPFCNYCEPPVRLVFRSQGDPPFWGCPQYTKHKDKKMILNHSDLLKKIEERRKLAQDEH